MGSMTIYPITPTYGGATLSLTTNRCDTGGSTSSIVIDHTTAQSALDLSKLVVRFENYSSTASFTITLTAGDDFSEILQGATTAITCATAAAAGSIKVFGGKSFESARFLQNDGTIVFTITTAATGYVSAMMLP